MHPTCKNQEETFHNTPMTKTMTKTIEEILAPKPEARLRIYAYSIDAPESDPNVVSTADMTRIRCRWALASMFRSILTPSV